MEQYRKNGKFPQQIKISDHLKCFCTHIWMAFFIFVIGVDEIMAGAEAKSMGNMSMANNTG